MELARFDGQAGGELDPDRLCYGSDGVLHAVGGISHLGVLCGEDLGTVRGRLVQALGRRAVGGITGGEAPLGFHWFDQELIHGCCGHVPPAAYEAAFYAGKDLARSGRGNR